MLTISGTIETCPVWASYWSTRLTLISTSFWGGETPLAAVDTSMRRKAPPVGAKDGADRTAGPPAPTPSVSVLYWISKAGRGGRPLDTAGVLAEVVCCCCCCCWCCGPEGSRGVAELSRRSGSDSEGTKWRRWPLNSPFAMKNRGNDTFYHYNTVGLIVAAIIFQLNIFQPEDLDVIYIYFKPALIRTVNISYPHRH